MSNTDTKKMLAMYQQMAPATRFLSGMFPSTALSFHNSEKVEYDILRSGQEVAIAIEDLSTGYRFNSNDIYTNKEITPPIFKEGIALNAYDAIKRQPNQNPFQSPDFRANIIGQMFRGMVKVSEKIKRAIELQASQVLQTGIATLIDSSGNTVYTVDWKPKSTHFVTAAITWGETNAVPLDNLAALGRVIRKDGLASPDMLIMGVSAYREFITDTNVKLHYETRRLDQGTIAPFVINGEGGQYRGFVEIENYRYDIWTYDGQYNHPQTGTVTDYVEPGNVIIRASSGVLEASYGAIPNIGKLLGTGGSNRFPELGRLSGVSGSGTNGGFDLTPNVWMSPDGDQLFGGVGTRPLMIPKAIDTFGTLDTGLTS